MPTNDVHRKNFDDLVLHLHEAIDGETMDAKFVVMMAKLVRFAGPFLFSLEKQVDDLDRRMERMEARIGRIEKVLEATTSLRTRSMAG